MSTCTECGRVSTEWHSYEPGAEVCGDCGQEALATAQAERSSAPIRPARPTATPSHPG